MPLSPEKRYGSVAAGYVQTRPTYPDALFQWLAEIAPARDLALDVACGNGQATVGVAALFKKVVATDISPDMIEHAPALPNVEYCVAAAEHTELEDDSVDLITVGMAVHWFDIAAFTAEARRVLKPDGVLCAWSYAEPYTNNPAIDAILDRCAQMIRPYGPRKLQHVWNGYRDLPLLTRGFDVVEPQKFTMHMKRSLEQIVAYYRTRSSVRAFTEDKGFDPVSELAEALKPLWGQAGDVRDIYWPMAIKVGRKHDPIATQGKELDALRAIPDDVSTCRTQIPQKNKFNLN